MLYFTTDLALLQRTWPLAGTVYPPSRAERLCWELTGGAWNQKGGLETAHTHICTHTKTLTQAHIASNRLARALAFTVRVEILMEVRCCEQWSRNPDQQAATSAASLHTPAPASSLNHEDQRQVLQQLWSKRMAEVF